MYQLIVIRRLRTQDRLLDNNAKIIKVTLEIQERKRNKSSSVSGKKVKKKYTRDFYSPTQQFRPFHTRIATRLLHIFQVFISCSLLFTRRLVFWCIHTNLKVVGSISQVLNIQKCMDMFAWMHRSMLSICINLQLFLSHSQSYIFVFILPHHEFLQNFLLYLQISS